MNTRAIFSITFAIILIYAGSIQADLLAENHTGAYIGFGIGFGGGQIKVDENDFASDHEQGYAINIRIGTAINNKLLIGAEIDTWRKKKNGVEIHFNNYAASLSYYIDEGFFIKGGPALSTVAAKAWDVSASESGHGFSIGAGYEMRTGIKFALVPSFQYIYQRLDGYSTNFYSFLLNFNWFW